MVKVFNVFFVGKTNSVFQIFFKIEFLMQKNYWVLWRQAIFFCFVFHICYVNYELGRSSEYLCFIISSNKVVWNKNGSLNFLWISVFWSNKFFLEAPRRLVILVIRNSKIGFKNPFLGSNSRTIKRTKFLQKF